MSGVNLKNVDLNLLVVFEAIYSAGNISHAASQLAMSQPAVSNALARLRDLVGDPLFMRARRGVEPTNRANLFIGPVRDALALIGTQLGRAREINLASYQRVFRICTMDIVEPLLLPPLLNMLAERAPEITIENILARPEIAQHVLRNTVDIACFVYPFTSPEVSIVPIAPMDLVIIARRNHPIVSKRLDVAAMKQVGYVALSTELRGFTQVDRELLVHNIKRRVVMVIPRLWSMPSIVAGTDLVGILLRPFAEHVARNYPIDIHELPVPMSQQHMYMMWNKKLDADPAHQWLRDSMLAIIKQQLRGSASDQRLSQVNRKN